MSLDAGSLFMVKRSEVLSGRRSFSVSEIAEAYDVPVERMVAVIQEPAAALEFFGPVVAEYLETPADRVCELVGENLHLSELLDKRLELDSGESEAYLVAGEEGAPSDGA